ncbi:hypothetical protein HNE05_08090 [Aquipseudomonas campi]|uniref:Uncharacterized protein n=1 Tax=Aquipseudomonas campi TaxID=2731681 RepID=A0A6M8F489_9GAMM|nr:hypothetical protein [Pseudomonas campi]QKE63324.1 hypothetical protein HNE05_08090 [Pseudomonas campi]
MLLLRRVILSILLVSFLLAAAFPGIVYIIGMYRVDGRPVPANPENYSQESMDKAWSQCREKLPIEVQPTNPWGVTSRLLFGNPLRTTPGELAAWRIASTYNAAHRMGNNTWWHTSGAALTIWVTRHWSAQQIAATMVRDNLCK